jgi:hypothetical protein
VSFPTNCWEGQPCHQWRTPGGRASRRGRPPQQKKKDFWRNIFLAVYSTAQTPGSPGAGHRGCREAGRSLETCCRRLKGRCAARKVSVLGRSECQRDGSLRFADMERRRRNHREIHREPKNFGPASKSSPSTSTRTRNDLQPGQPATCQRNLPAQAALAPPPTSTQRSTSHQYR